METCRKSGNNPKENKFCKKKKKRAAQKPMPNTACFLLNVVFLNFNHVNIKKKNHKYYVLLEIT
jgi:hypothetical protein